MVSAQDIVNSAYKLKGAPYRTWCGGDPIPMWLYDGYGDPPDASHLLNVGVECSDLINFALQDNGLLGGGGTESFANYLVNTSAFDPSTPGQAGAIAFCPYLGPWVGSQGHIALYVDDHYLIQALDGNYPYYGITDQFTDAETYSWGGDTVFTVYGFLPGVDYSGSGGGISTGQGTTAPYVAIDSSGYFRYNGPDWSQGWYDQNWVLHSGS